MTKKVLIAAPVHPILTRWLEANGYECIVKEHITQNEAAGLVGDCSGIITSTRLLINKELIDAAPGLGWIGRMGSGMEVIDVPYATQKGIACYGSPEGNRNAVAEHALGMLLGLNKKIVKSNYEVREGKWIREENRGVELEGKTIGIIGYGNTGSAFARKLYGFDMRVLVYDKYLKGAVPKYMEECSNLEEIYREADIISFHVPLQKDTRYMFDEDFVGRMQRPFVLVNTSRGMVVKPAALLAGLESRKILGACLDVWEEEPPFEAATDRDIFNKISSMPQVLITPHIAGYSAEALYKMSKVLLDKIVTKR